ncbi:DUF7344 domain-containing protein [Haloarcula laminariae]|uniref:DUF7344 domain-containing protein n=1 Tax=Haloarcula laminariae TaxID=2961577 RepID=UPI0024072FE4|nr:hypothetical protein [Halomicroarcula sp. FL173]
MSKAISGTGETPESAGVQSGQNRSELSRDDAFEMLSNRRRRFILHYLQDEDAAATLSDLAEQVAAWENETDIASISASERKTVYTSLQQFHLPKMDETGIVEFDQRAGEVHITDAAQDLDIYLEVVDEYDIPWSFYYIGFSAIGTILVTLSWLDIGPFAAIPYIGWTVFLLAALLVSSMSHYVLTRRNRLGTGESPPEVSDA